MPWQNTLQEIRTRMSNISPQMQQLNDRLSRSVLQYEQFNSLVGETNAQILDRLKVLTHGNLQATANQPLNQWHDAAINNDIVRAGNYARQAVQQRAQFEQTRREPAIAQSITAVHSELQALSVGRLQVLQAEIRNEAPNSPQAASEFRQLSSQLAESGLQIDGYFNDLRAPETAATVTMTPTDLVAVTPQGTLQGAGGSLNEGDARRGRSHGITRVNVPDRGEHDGDGRGFRNGQGGESQNGSGGESYSGHGGETSHGSGGSSFDGGAPAGEGV